MKLAYCGYDFFKDCLSGLLDSGHEVIRVFSFNTDNKYDFNNYIFSIAEEKKIPISIGGVSENDIDDLVSRGCDVILSAGYPYKIPSCNGIPYRLNIHPSPLPYGRGAWPMPYAILNGFDEWAVTVHELTDKWDAGPIVSQVKFPISADEKLESLSVKCQIAARGLIKDVFSNIDFFWSNRFEQVGGVYLNMPKRLDKTIDWSWPINKIDRYVRAFSKHEARAVVCGKTIFVRDVVVWLEPHSYAIGDVVARTNKEIVVAASNGFVCLRFWATIPEVV